MSNYILYLRKKKTLCRVFFISILALLLADGASATEIQSNTAPDLGSVNFDTSCQENAEFEFERGLTMLHHMMYFQAQKVFDDATMKNPDCAMLYWGVAMSYFHPLWPGFPTEKAMAAGNTAVETMNSIDNVSDLERAFIEAVSAFYTADTKNYRERISAWAKKQMEVFSLYPNNIDAGALSALSQLATAPRGDKTFAQQRATGEVLEMLNEKAKRHPGLVHYAIHAYDNPALAEKGRRFAEVYGEFSPNVAHALHMPSHIFVRLGLWDETVDWNKRSANAALAHRLAGDTISSHYAHAMDYGIYAHLQRGEFDVAEKALATFRSYLNQQSNFGSAYALAASPVRVLLEQDQWAEAAALPTKLHPAIAWEKFPQCRAIFWFAKGIGAVRSENKEIATEALAELAKIRTVLKESKQNYWLQLIDAQMMSIDAWVEYNEGNKELAITLLTKASDIEDAAGKSPVTPSHVLPARELLAELYAALGQKENATASYQKVLSATPNRRRSLEKLQDLN